MASEMSLATDRTSSLSNRRSWGMGSVLVTTTLVIAEFLRRSTAGSDRTAWVAMHHTSAAPRSARRSAAATMVPAVSIMSSISTHWRPSVSYTHLRAHETDSYLV